jgi:hypothetical protein
VHDTNAATLANPKRNITISTTCIPVTHVNILTQQKAVLRMCGMHTATRLGYINFNKSA